MSYADLGKRVKAKYPGAYDDISDDQLGQKVSKKYPGAYDDIVSKPAQTQAPAAAQPKSVAGFGHNLVSSAVSLGKNIGNAVLHPVKTVESIADLPVGLAEKGINAVAGKQVVPTGSQDTLDRLVEDYKKRYGGLQNIADTAYSDPVGVAADVAGLLEGGGAALRGASIGGKSAKLAKAGEVAAEAARATDPVQALIRGTGKAVEKATPKVNVAPFARSYQADAAKAAAEEGVQLPISALSKSKAVQVIEQGAGKGLFGQDISRGVEHAGEQLNNAADRLVASASKVTDPAEVGSNLVKGLNSFKDTFSEVKNKLYADAKLPEKLPVYPKETLDFLTKVIKDKGLAAGGSQDLAYFKRLKSDLKGKPAKAVPASVPKPAAITAKNAEQELNKAIISRDPARAQKALGLVSKEVKPSYEKLVKKMSGPGAARLPNQVAFEKAAQSGDNAALKAAYAAMSAAEKKTVSGTAALEKALKDVTGKKGRGISAQAIRSTIKELDKKIGNYNDPIATGNKAELSRIATSLRQSLESAVRESDPKAYQALEAANQYYAQNVEKINSQLGKAVMKYADRPEKIVDAVIQPHSESIIPTLYEIVGEENIPAIQASFMKKVFDSSKTADGTLSYAKLNAKLKQYSDPTVRAVLSNKQYQAMQRIKKITEAFNQANDIRKGSQTAFNSRVMGEVAASFLQPTVALKVFGGDFAASKFVNSQLGRDLLTTGRKFTGATGKAIQKSAGKAGSPALKALLNRQEQEQP